MEVYQTLHISETSPTFVPFSIPQGGQYCLGEVPTTCGTRQDLIGLAIEHHVESSKLLQVMDHFPESVELNPQ